ncbi:MAG: DUF421 domain-containing protein [Sphingobacteriales bacterium]|nr:MAG: DUF421 domain-containing protein [Sphingobacteriales bacterium]
MQASRFFIRVKRGKMENMLEHLLGLDEEKLTIAQMSLRAVIVFILAVFYVRLGGMRAFGQGSSIDVVMTVVLGAILGRSILGGSIPFAPALVAGFVICMTHRALAFACYYSDAFSKLIKGRKILLVKDGELIKKNMLRTQISQGDLEERIRINANISSTEDISEAYYERSGDISIVKKEKL